MIVVWQEMVDGARSSRGSVWRAWAEVDAPNQVRGMYEAKSRNGAPQELARVLVDGGIPDQPVVTKQPITGDRVRVSYPSLHRMALWTFEESAAQPLRRRRWAPHPGNIDQEGGGRP